MINKELGELKRLLEGLEKFNEGKNLFSLNDEELKSIENDIYKNIKDKLQICNTYVELLIKDVKFSSINSKIEVEIAEYMNSIDVSKKNLSQKTFKLDRNVKVEFEKFCKSKSGYEQQALVSIALKYFIDKMEEKYND